MIGTVVRNRYEVLEKIGEGGTAIVYKAKDKLLERFVALKVLKEDYNNDVEFVEKFRKEAMAAASLSHTNIVNIFDVGAEDNINYIVMEYVSGKTLKELIKENIRLSYQQTITIAIQIASALECAHKNELIHRDIKPQNILLTEDGIAKVTDFGIAKVAGSVTITNSSQIIGSAHYFSPEQAKGSVVDCKTDIYSLGIVMYEMITGKVPYDAESLVSVAIKHIQEPLVPPKQIIWDMPESLNRVILKAAEKEPIKRYQSAKDLLADLNRIKGNIDYDVKLSTVDDDFTKVMNPVVLNDEEEDDDEDRKPMKKSIKIVLFILLCLVVIAAAIAAGKVAAGLNSSSNSSSSSSSSNTGKIAVPDIIGKSSKDAEKIVVGKKLKYVVAETESNDAAEGTVLSCNYKAGDLVTEDTSIRVSVSAGPEAVKVDNLKGMPQSTAEDTITAAGFVVGQITTQNDSDVPEGDVISQNPDADTPYQKGKKVDIVVSKGPKIETVKVPDLKSMSLDEAKTMLSSKGLKLNAAYATPTDKLEDDNKIFIQDKKAGSFVNTGDTINVTYYKYDTTGAQ